MPVRETSKAAYFELKDTGRLTDAQRAVMLTVHAMFTGRTFTRKELGRALAWEINRVTPRVGELIAKNFLEETTERRDGGYLLRIKPAQLELAA